jgi:hypothetical protein
MEEIHHKNKLKKMLQRKSDRHILLQKWSDKDNEQTRTYDYKESRRYHGVAGYRTSPTIGVSASLFVSLLKRLCSRRLRPLEWKHQGVFYFPDSSGFVL